MPHLREVQVPASALAVLTQEHLTSVYSGRPGCMCGCRGKHTYRQADRHNGMSVRGYEFSDKDCNDSVVRRHLKALQSLPPKTMVTLDVKDECTVVHVSFENKAATNVKVLYLADEVRLHLLTNKLVVRNPAKVAA